MFDDAYPDVWLGVEDLLEQYNAHVTLYITWYSRIDQTARDKIRQLADAGHDIEAHSVNHIRGPNYVDAHGLDDYMANEVIPSFEILPCGWLRSGVVRVPVRHAHRRDRSGGARERLCEDRARPRAAESGARFDLPVLVSPREIDRHHAFARDVLRSEQARETGGDTGIDMIGHVGANAR